MLGSKRLIRERKITSKEPITPDTLDTLNVPDVMKLRQEAEELQAYLDSYDASIIRELRDTENKLKTYIEEAQKQIWFIEGIKQLGQQNIHASDECPRCPFFQKWLKDAFQSRFNVELYEVEAVNE